MPEGALTLGRYDCLCLLGRGGMAEVWAARARGARGFQKLVALKMLLPAMLDDPSCERMFLDEASVASRIQHPNAVEVMDLGEEQGRLFIAMEYVDGASLSALSRVATLPLPLPLALEIVVAACFGLHAAHGLKDEQGAPLGVVHRDVSPHNILISRDGSVKVADFGIAKAMAKSSGTDIGVVKGKLAYMAPEQARAEHLDRRADVFALGVVLYELTTGVHPFRGQSPEHTARKLLGSDWVPPREVAKGAYPAALQEVVLRAMAPQAEQRPATALELGLALQALAQSENCTAAPGALAALVERYLGPELERRDQLIRGAPSRPQPAPVQELMSERGGVTIAAAPGALAETQAHPRSRLAWLAAGIVLVLLGATAAVARSLTNGAKQEGSLASPEPGRPEVAAPMSSSPTPSLLPVAQGSTPTLPAVPEPAPAAAAAKASRAPLPAKPVRSNRPAPQENRTAPVVKVPVRDPGF